MAVVAPPIKWVRSLLLLSSTAAPGVQRLLFIAAVRLYFGSTELGRVASDIGIATFISCAAGGAISAHVLAQWRSISTVDAPYFSGLYLVWMGAILLLAAPCLILLKGLGWVSYVVPCAVFLVGITSWQVQRAKLIATECLLRVCVLEAFIAISISAAAGLSRAADTVVLCYGGALLAASAMCKWVRPRIRRAGFFETGRQMAYYAGNALVGAGRDALAAPAAQALSGPQTAAVVAQLSAIAAAVLLLPRALAYSYLPKLRLSGGGIDHSESRKYNRAIKQVLMAISGASAAAIAFLFVAKMVRGYELMLCVLIVLELLVAQYALYPSNLLLALGAPQSTFFSALIAFHLWLAAWAIVTAVGADAGFLLLLMWSLLLTICRTMWLRRRAYGAVQAT